MKTSENFIQITKGFETWQVDSLYPVSQNIKMTFIRCSSGGFKFGQKYVRTRNVPTPKFTHSLLHLQTAKKSLILADYRCLHVRKMKQSVDNMA